MRSIIIIFRTISLKLNNIVGIHNAAPLKSTKLTFGFIGFHYQCPENEREDRMFFSRLTVPPVWLIATAGNFQAWLAHARNCAVVVRGGNNWWQIISVCQSLRLWQDPSHGAVCSFCFLTAVEGLQKYLLIMTDSNFPHICLPPYFSCMSDLLFMTRISA